MFLRVMQDRIGFILLVGEAFLRSFRLFEEVIPIGHARCQ